MYSYAAFIAYKCFIIVHCDMTLWHMKFIVFLAFSKEFWEYLTFVFMAIFISVHDIRYLTCVQEGKVQRKHLEMVSAVLSYRF